MQSNKLTRDISSVLGSSIITLLLGFLTGIVIARSLGPDGRGELAALLIIPGLFASVALLGTRQSAIFVIGRKIYEDEKVVSAIFISLLFSTLAGGGICFLYFQYLTDLSFSYFLIILAILNVPTRLLIIYTGGFFLGKEKFGKAALLKILPSFFNLIFTIIFLLLFKMNLAGALLAMVLSNLIVNVLVIFEISKSTKIRFRFYRDVQFKMIRLGFLYAVSMLIMQLNYRIDIILLQGLSDNRQTGLYALAVSLSQILWYFPSSIGTVIRTRTANASDKTDLSEQVSKLLRISLIICSAGAVILFFAGTWIIPFFYGSVFSESAFMLNAILPGTLLMVIFKVLNSSFAGMGKPQITIFIFTPVMIENILLNFWLIPLYGGTGAAWASSISYATGGIVVLLIYSLTAKKSIASLLTFRKNDFRDVIPIFNIFTWLKRSR